MGSIVGFTLHLDSSSEEITPINTAENTALARFTHLEKLEVSVGAATLRVWGHAPITNRIHNMPDGSALILVGSPHGNTTLTDVQEILLKSDRPGDFTLPWDGRVILLHISADGKRWTLWNDWLGSITMYRANTEKNRIISTLEPVVTAATRSTPNDIFLPGLVSLLLNGYFMSDWTLYKDVKTLPPDSHITWDETGFRANKLWTVQASQDRWESSWDNLVDEMHALIHQSTSTILRTQPTWVLPLSAGLDSRITAGIAAGLGVNVRTYAWGNANNTDVYYSQQIAKTLGFPWKHIRLPMDFLARYSPQWLDWYGLGMHFQGMYLMSFLDELKMEPSAPMLNGFLGDVLSGDGLNTQFILHSTPQYRPSSEWYGDWQPELLKAAAKFPIAEALEANREQLKEEIDPNPGARFQKLLYLELWTRQRLFTSFLSTLQDYWRGVANPYLNRSYARFCFSLPRLALDNRRLVGEVVKRYYGNLAVIPGSYGKEPYIVTGKFLIKRRISNRLPSSLRKRFVKGMDYLHIPVDLEPLQAGGKDSLWPLAETWEQVAEWLDLRQVESDFQDVMKSGRDTRPLRRLQAVQTFAAALHRHLPK